MRTIYQVFFLAFIGFIVNNQLNGQHTVDWANAQPIPLPVYTPPTGNTPNAPIKYNTAEQTETIGTLPSNTLPYDRLEGFSPRDLHGSDESLWLNRDFSALQQVSDPTSFPFLRTVKLFMQFPSGASGVCSGALIDSKHVLTAGHCVHSISEGGWATSVDAVPAFENGNAPFGAASSENIYSWSSWTNNEDYDWDVAYIELDRPIGAITGWFGLAYNDNNSFYASNSFHTPSYPSESPFNGQFMYYYFGSFDFFQDQVLYHYNRGYRGQSGSNTYFIDNDQRFVHAVLSHGNPLIPTTGHVRLNETKFNSIVGNINQNTPNQVDLVPLFVKASPSSVEAGQALNDFSFLVHNYSESTFNGNLSVDVYLSPNEIISTNDTYITTLALSNATLGPKGTLNLSPNNPLQIPATISSGNYFIGVLIDINDSDNSNNATSNWDVDPITITTPPPSLSVTPTSINFGSSADDRSITVSSNVSWSATESASWLSLSNGPSGSGNGSFSVNCTTNTSTSSRSATVTVSGGGITRTINVTQQGASPLLTVTPTSINFGSSADDRSITVSSNVSWSASESASWLSLSNGPSGSGNGSFSVNCTTNTSTSSRTATVTVSGGGITRTINVAQQGASPQLTVSPSSVSFSSSADDRSISVSSNTSWSATESASWLSLSNGPSGSGNGSFSVNCTTNTSTSSRTATVTVSGGGITRTINVTQQGASPLLTVTPTSINFGSSADDRSITVSSNVSWSASESASWLSLSNGPSGSGNGSFTINCTTNTSTSSRSATVTVSGGGITRTINVNQQGTNPYLTVSSELIDFNESGGDYVLTISSNITWSTSVDASWLLLSPQSGDGDGMITVSCEANPAPDSRTTTITLTGGGITRTINITQSATLTETLVFSPSDIQLDWQGNGVTGQLEVTPARDWIATTSEPWIVVSNLSGVGSQQITISANSINESGSSRIGTVYFDSPTSSFELTVTQASNDIAVLPPWGSPTPTIASGTLIGQVQIEGQAASPGDWIGAFDEMGNLAGSKEVIVNQGIAYINIVIYGDDTNTVPDEGINAGEGFVLKLFDASTGEVLDYPNTDEVFTFMEWANTNGAPIPAYSSPDDIYDFSNARLSFSPSSITLDWEGSAEIGLLSVHEEASWVISASEDWLQVTPLSGIGAQEIMIGASPHTASTIPRTAWLEISSNEDSIMILVTQLGGEEMDGPDWGAPTPTIASGTFIGQIQINGVPASTGDWLAAFDEDGNLAGSKEIIMNQGIAYTNLVIYGDDSATVPDEGIGAGESFSLRLYDASENRVLLYPNANSVYNFTEWVNTNGAPMPAYSSPDAIYNFTTAHYDSIFLSPGWNLVSTDLIPTDSSVVAIMSDLKPNNLEYVTGFDGTANFYDPTLPELFSTLTHWERGFGYWVKVVEADTLLIEGQAIDTSYFKPMDMNWNLIAYIPQDEKAPNNYLSHLIDGGQLQYATGFDGVFQFYDPFGLPFLNDLISMHNSKGYWIKLQDAPTIQDARVSARRVAPNIPNPTFEFLWGHTDLPKGARIEVVDESGKAWAELVVNEQGRFLPQAIYGDHLSTVVLVEGPIVGTNLSFIWQGQKARATYQFTGDLSVHELDLQFKAPEEGEMNAFPNPFKDRLEIQFYLGQIHPTTITITNSLGQTIWTERLSPTTKGFHQTSWEPNGQRPGLYFVNVVQQGKTIHRTKVIMTK
ncbi:MAG: BACON domain-containing carbohydrate-binding protein [Bacteroidota bacterium]